MLCSIAALPCAVCLRAAALKVGGRALADAAVIARCVEAAKMRHKEVLKIMEQSLAAHEQQGPGGQG